MESNNKFNFNLVFSIASLCFSLLSIFIMYYAFAGIALVTGLVSLDDERSRKLSITSIILVGVTFIIKMIFIVMENGNLPIWFMNGLI